MAWLPDVTMLVTEKVGQLRLIRQGKLLPTPIAGVPEVMSSGQGGLMDMSLHPQFTKKPIITHSQEYFGGEISQERSRAGMVDPKVVWTPSIAPSGLAIYTGARFPAWQGDIFAGRLVSKDIRRLDLDDTGNVKS
jgi:glucose/arabinose dehydrogenase